MTKYHINSKGVPSVCKAEKGKCPFGGENEHYTSKEEALIASQKKLSNEFGILGQRRKPEEIPKLDVWKRKDLAKLISDESPYRNNGFEYECQASVAIAEEMQLEKIAVIKSDGSISPISMVSRKKCDESEVPLEKSVDILSEHYEKLGVSIKDKPSLARVIYYSEDPSRGVLIQSGGSNVLDAAVIKNDKVEDLIEIKELSNGAQMSSTALDVDANGKIIRSSLYNRVHKEVALAIADMNIKDAEGTNTTIEFDTPQKRRLAPLAQFLYQYRKKGATSLVYIADKGSVVNRVSLEGTKKEVFQRFLDNRLFAECKLRANMNPVKAKSEDLSRLFEDDSILKEKKESSKTFKLSDVKPEKITKSGDLVRVGSFVVQNIKYDDYKDNLDKDITLDDLKTFKLTLTGKISCKQTKIDLLDLKKKQRDKESQPA